MPTLPTTYTAVVGEVCHGSILQVGDVLYLPRGTIHAAVTNNESASCHVTISTYQQWSYATLAQHLLQALTAGQTPEACLPLELRRGLHLGFLYQHGLQQDALGPPGAGDIFIFSDNIC